MTTAAPKLTLRDIPVVNRGAGGRTCCPTHRDRCLIGHPHVWSTWYDNGALCRTTDTYKCWRCDGICTADEASPPARQLPRLQRHRRRAAPLPLTPATTDKDAIMAHHTPRSAERIRKLLDAANDARKAAFIAALTADPDPLGTVGRARAYIARPDLCTRTGLIDWVAGLCDLIEAATAEAAGWQSTAEALADPELTAALTGPIEDHGPVPPPDAIAAAMSPPYVGPSREEG